MFPSIIHTYSILRLQSVDSTNNYAASHENQSLMQHKTVILATFQTKGKGQFHNKWSSEEGKNLLLSIYIKAKTLSVDRQFDLSRITALSIQETISYFLKKDVRIKWPNDLYINDKKIAGILIENTLNKNEIDRSIIGIGINVNQEIFKDLNASSFKLESNIKWDSERILEYLLYRFNHHFESLNNNKQEIHQAFDLHLYKRGEWLTMKCEKLGVFIGKIIGTQNNGMLKVEGKDKSLYSFNHKEIEFNSILPPNDQP